MKGFRISVFFVVLASIFILAFARPTFAAYASPFQIRMVMFRVLDFFNDTIDSALPQSPGGNGQPAPTQVPPQNPNPPAPSGACPFQAVTTIRECLDASCTQTQPISDFDNNQQYGAANDLRIVNVGDAPDAGFPFGHAGRPGEIIIATGDQAFPTGDGYQRGDPVDVKVYLDANKDGVIDNNWQLVAKQCENFGSIAGCPDSQSKYYSTNAPLDEIQNMVVDCGLNIRYGWLLKKTGSAAPTQTQQLTAQPTNSQQNPQPTNSTQNPTTIQSTPIPPTGSPPQGGITQAEIQAIINTISEANIQTYLTTLVDDDDTAGQDEDQTRYSTFPGYQTESAYVKKFFDDLGIQSEFQNFSLSGGQSRNVIARIPGFGPKKNEHYLVIAHLDSTSSNTGHTNDPAPGADDNGSGSVAVMEIAKAIKQSGKSLNYSLEFILFGGEEQGLKGSQHYVTTMSGKSIKGVINLDMIGWVKNPPSECVTFGYRNYDGGNVIADTVKQMSDSLSLGFEARSSPSSIDSSDHGAFWSRNITAIFGYECGLLSGGSVSNPYYHRVTDKTTNVSFSQITKTAKAVTGAVLSLAADQ